jgi:DNA-binding CsgD family transcriptional regulator
MIMYCVTLLSTICVIVIGFGGPFLLGLLVFYLSAGFFSVYFTVGFMDISYHSAKPKLWAGLGRAVNNVCALMIMTLAGGFASVRYEVMIVAVILFFLISVLAFSYQNILIGMELRSMESAASALMPQTGGAAESENKQTGGAAEPEDKQAGLSTTDKFTAFGEQYSLTEREREVLRALLSSGENVQDIAHTLGISRAAIYRHISNMNEKTATKARMGLIQFYYGWNPEK